MLAGMVHVVAMAACRVFNLYGNDTDFYLFAHHVKKEEYRCVV